MPIFEPESTEQIDPFDTRAVQAAAQRRLQAQQAVPDQGKTGRGFISNGMKGWERGSEGGSVGGPVGSLYGGIGGFLSESLMGLTGQKNVDKWREKTPSPSELMKARKAKKTYDDATALETSDTMGSNAASDLGDESMLA